MSLINIYLLKIPLKHNILEMRTLYFYIYLCSDISSEIIFMLDIIPMVLCAPWANTSFDRQSNKQVSGTKSYLLSQVIDSL